MDESTGDGDKLQADQVKLVRLRQEYARFSEAADLPQQHARMETAGFTWKHGKAAERVARITGTPEAAMEQSPRPMKGANFAVDWGIIHSESYRDKFDGLSNNPVANSAVCTRARWALNNRDGVRTEELYAIDMNTGDEIARITDQHIEQGVKRTTRFDKSIENAVKNNADIMIIHNHPASSPPSIGDLNVLLSTPGARGVVVGHDGSVYQYTAPKEKIPQFEFDIAILKYKGYTYVTAFEKALQDLAGKYGFSFSKL